jgi:hypothetical protein
MTTTTTNDLTRPEEKLTRSDYVIMSIASVFVIFAISFLLNEVITYLLVNAFGYSNFEVRFSNYTELSIVLLVTLAFTSLILAILHRLLLTYSIMTLLILAITTTMFLVQKSGMTTEQYAYHTSLKQFENQYLLSGDKGSIASQHPDMINFYAYKDNNLLSESTRRDYFNMLSATSTKLNDISKYTTVYNLGFFADYFLSKQDSDKFFMAYSDVKDPELRNELESMMKNPLIKTLDYAAFHANYRKKFVENNASLVDVKLPVYVTTETKRVKMTDLQNISSIIHFFDNNKELALTPIKTEFVNLLSQPSISIVDVDQFRHNLTSVLKSDTKLYSLMSQL